jgi:hypothetical protein
MPIQRKPIKAGKKETAWRKTRAKLKKLFESKNLTYCLLNYPGCWKEVHGFAHALRRRFITDDESLLCAIPACNFCHKILDEKSHAETEAIVKQIRAETL